MGSATLPIHSPTVLRSRSIDTLPNTDVNSNDQMALHKWKEAPSQAPLGGCDFRPLALGVLRRLAGALEADFLALFDARVAGEQASLAQGRAEGRVVLQ